MSRKLNAERGGNIRAIINNSEKTDFSPKLNEVIALRIESRMNAILFFTIDKMIGRKYALLNQLRIISKEMK